MKKEMSKWFISYNFKNSKGMGFGQVDYTINGKEIGTKHLNILRKDLEQTLGLGASVVILNIIKLKYEGDA
jgi:hypothetical protein